jgi:hypothetical protein
MPGLLHAEASLNDCAPRSLAASPARGDAFQDRFERMKSRGIMRVAVIEYACNATSNQRGERKKVRLRACALRRAILPV